MRNKRDAPPSPPPPPPPVEVSRLAGGGEERWVISVPLVPPRWPVSLTGAERVVAEMLLDGASSADIARARGTSESTVANQVAAIFRKAAVSSRVELAARVYGATADDDDGAISKR